MASSFRKAQIPIRARGNKKCPQHAGKEVIFVCKDCGELACSICVSTIHRTHAVGDISEIIPQVKVTIQDFVKTAETKYIPELNGELKNLDDKISGNKNHFKKVIFEIAKQNETLKQELDTITNKLIASCREVENKNDDILNKHRAELQSKIEELNARLLELKDTLQSGTNTQVYDTSRGIPNDVSIPTLPSIPEMNFKPTSFLIGELEQLVGEILQTTGDSQTQIKCLVPGEESTGIASENEKGNYTVKRKQPHMSSKKGRNLEKSSEKYVENFIPLKTFTHQTSIDSICATSHSRVWVQYDKELHLLDNTGKTQKTMEMEVVITDFCVSPSTGDIWFCSDDDNSIRKYTGDNKSTVLFYTDNKPASICISADGYIVVGIRQQIVKYAQDGQILCKSGAELKWLRKKGPVVRYPRRIGQCPVTGNIAVVDRNYKSCGGDDKPHVSLLSEDLQLLCRYYGRDIESFDPWDVRYSDRGDVYIAQNKSIQQISGSGQFIRTVYTDNDKLAKYLSVQSNGDIWVVFKQGNITATKKVVILKKQ